MISKEARLPRVLTFSSKTVLSYCTVNSVFFSLLLSSISLSRYEAIMLSCLLIYMISAEIFDVGTG